MVRRIRIGAPIAVNSGKYSHRLIKGGVGHNLPLAASIRMYEKKLAVVHPHAGVAPLAEELTETCRSDGSI